MSQTKPSLNIIPVKSKLEESKEQIIDVLLRIKTPEINLEGIKRPPLNLCVALDRSGSMGGNKIREAIEATKMCIDRMGSEDQIGLVVFDDHVETIFPNRPVTDKSALKSQVERIMLGGSTALHAGWVQGGIEVSKKQAPNAVNRVLLITDGQANVGESRSQVLTHQARELNLRGISTTTIGIGQDFNEDLLIPMGEAGGGNAWHVETPESMTKIFDIELNGLVNQFGHSVTLGIEPTAGVEVLDVLNDFQTEADGRYKLPNLTAANDLDVVVKVKIPPTGIGNPTEIAKFNITFVGQASGIAERAEASLSLSFVSSEEAATVSDDPIVEEATILLSNARDRQEVMAYMDRHDYEGAQRVLGSLHSRVYNANAAHPSVLFEDEMTELARERQMIAEGQGRVARKSMAFASKQKAWGKFQK